MSYFKVARLLFQLQANLNSHQPFYYLNKPTPVTQLETNGCYKVEKEAPNLSQYICLFIYP